LIVSEDTASVRQACIELFEESLHEDDTNRALENLVAQEADPETLKKALPVRTLVNAFYEYAAYLMWLRGMLSSDVELEILADEAEGLRTLEAARQEFERAHPACPQCRFRQYSTAPMTCRNRACRMDFRKKR
jgi:hypothetical protein